MTDGSKTARPGEKRFAKPPVLLLAGFLAVATAGAVFVSTSTDPQDSAVTTTLAIAGAGSRNSAGGSTGAGSSSGKTDVSQGTDASADPNGPDVESKDPETERLFVGVWRQERHGERTLTMKSDGTATMTIIPGGFYSLAFGKRIDLTMFWSMKDGHLDYGINGGTPPEKVKMAIKLYGDHWVEKIVELDETKLNLFSARSKTHSIWERVPTPAEEAPK